jgi:alkylation response protein AidB-like acyl-CoA dehydrogenase
MSRFLTEEQELIKKAAKDFTEKEVKPRAMDIDRANELPVDLLKRCGDLGFIGAVLPEQIGGLNQGWTTGCIICEEVAKESPGLAVSLFVQMAASGILLNSAPLAAKHGPSLMEGSKVFGFAFTPPEGISNPTEWSVLGKREGEDWVLNGTKLYITNTRAADIVLAAGLTDDYQMGGWVLEKGQAGIDCNVERKMGLAGNNSGTYAFKNCRVSKDNFLLVGSDVFRIDLALCLCPAVSLGLAEGVFAKTLEFTKVRTHAGKPLITKQAVAHQLAKMYIEIEASRSMLYDATRLADEGRNDEAKILISAAKYYCTEMAVDISRQCIHLHGGMAYIEDTGIARYMRDAMGLTIADFTPGLHLESISGLLGNPEAEVIF